MNFIIVVPEVISINCWVVHCYHIYHFLCTPPPVDGVLSSTSQSSFIMSYSSFETSLGSLSHSITSQLGLGSDYLSFKVLTHKLFCCKTLFQGIYICQLMTLPIACCRRSTQHWTGMAMQET